MKFLISADNLRVDVHKASDGKLQPALGGAQNGSVLLELSKAELQGMLMAFAQAAAADQGAKVDSVELTLSQAGARSVAASLRIRAKKMFVPAVVVATGRADVDERLTVTISDLRCSGEGVVGGAVAAMLTPKLREFEGKTFVPPLEAAAKLRLKDITVDAGDPLRISARFEG